MEILYIAKKMNKNGPKWSKYDDYLGRARLRSARFETDMFCLIRLITVILKIKMNCNVQIAG